MDHLKKARYLFTTVIVLTFNTITMAQQINATYIGGPTVILEIEGIRFMTDPTLDEKGTTYKLGELTLEKTLDPFTSDIGKIDYVLLSHDQHQDNLDNRGRELLKTVKKVFTTQEASENIDANAVGLSTWQSDNIIMGNHTEITITATPARHGPAGTKHIAGTVTGFLITVKGDTEYQLYITGDTVFYEEIQEVAQTSRPRYVFAFAGAVQHWDSIYMTMNDSDVVNTSFAFPDATIIPVHYEGWKHYTRDEKGIVQTLDHLEIDQKLKLLNKGTTTILPIN